VPLQLFHRTADAGSADDGAHSFGDLQLIHRIAKLVAVLALDAARDPTGARVVGHQHQEAAGEADVGGQRRTLVAALLLLDLDDDFLPFGEQFAHAAAALRLAVTEEFPG